MRKNSKIYTNRWFWVTVIVILVLLSVVPFIINESYKHGGYITMWDAADMLSYYGSILSFFGTAVLGFIAVSQTKEANNLSDKLVQLEANKYKLEVRPFVMVTDYLAYMNNQFDLLTNPDKLYIMASRVEEYEPKVMCIALSLTNTTNSYISVQYSEANVVDGIVWTNSMSNQKDPNLRLNSGETGEVVFYAPSQFFQEMKGKRIRFRFILENRFSKRYAEEFSAIIVSLSADVIGHSKESNWYISMFIQEFAVSRFEKDGNGKIVEIQEEL